MRPAVGAHLIECSEETVTVHGDPEYTFLSSDEGFVPLLNAAVSVNIVAGEREKLSAQIIGDPFKTLGDYSVSLGKVNASNFRDYASADYLILLGSIRVVAVDAGNNILSGELPQYNTSSIDVVYGPAVENMHIIERSIRVRQVQSVHFSFYPLERIEADSNPAANTFRELSQCYKVVCGESNAFQRIQFVISLCRDYSDTPTPLLGSESSEAFPQVVLFSRCRYKHETFSRHCADQDA